MRMTLHLLGSILLVALGIGFVVGWEYYGKEKFDTTEVIVATETIDFKEQLTEENIQIMNVRRGTKVENALPVTRYESLIGEYASIKIEKGAQLYSELVDTYDLIPDASKGEFVAPIPQDWLLAVPGSLRRTYIADIYAIGDKDQAVIQALVKDAKAQSGKTEAADEIASDLVNASTPILEGVRVASVKDSNNKEVTESKESDQATGSVATIEVIATAEMLEKIEKSLQSGSKLYVVYRFERANENNELAKAGETDETE